MNCWHIAERESAAMWSGYAGHGGIAVKSTVGSLGVALRPDRRILVGRVNYIDYDDPNLDFTENPLDRLLHKRLSFESEHELRLIAFDLPPDMNVFKMPSDDYVGPAATQYRSILPN